MIGVWARRGLTAVAGPYRAGPGGGRGPPAPEPRLPVRFLLGCGRRSAGLGTFV
jgi:hypothetical protein